MKISNLKDTSSLLEIVFVGLSEVCVCLEFNLLFFFFSFFLLAAKLIGQVSGCEFLKKREDVPLMRKRGLCIYSLSLSLSLSLSYFLSTLLLFTGKEVRISIHFYLRERKRKRERGREILCLC